MLHAHPDMTDIDTDQWRSLQTVLTVSAKARPRIVVIHESGTLLKLRHSEGRQVLGDMPALGATVADPRELAKLLYDANAETTDFVAVFERGAIERHYAEHQDSWEIEEDLDVYVRRGNLALDEQGDGIITHPGAASTQLGLQFRSGASYEEVVEAVGRYVPAGAHVALGVLDGDRLGASLVLGFDDEHEITHITTAQPSALTPGPLADVARQVSDWVRSTHGRCDLGLFAQRSEVEQLLERGISTAVLGRLVAEDKLIAEPLPAELGAALGVSR